jgi:hypothetical protein
VALSTVVLTGKYGPALTATATSIPNVRSFRFDFINQMIYVVQNGNVTIQEFDMNGKTSLTWTVSSGVYTLTIA